ncbi:MAG TPA: hypothetical protein VIW73_13700 [Candidatus Cybelea sp.]
MEVRPLDLGDIFNRAITLYMRHFRALAGIALAAILPLALVQYVTLRLEGPQLDALLAVWQHPERLGTQQLPTVFNSPTALAPTIVSVLVGYLVMTFAVCAVAVATSEVYRNEAISVGRAYRTVLARWPAILGMLGIVLGVLIVCYVVLVLIVSIPLIIGAMISQAVIFIVPVIGLVAVVAIFFALALLLVTGAFAFFGIAVEGRSVPTSIELAVSRIYTRSQFGRALVCAIAAGAVMTVPAGLVDTVAFFGLGRYPAGYIALDSVVRWAILPFSALILAVYYFDVRVRREGFDLEDGIFSNGADDAGYAPTAYLSGRERALIKRFLERRDTLTPQRRAAIAAQLAQPARERVPEELRSLDDESLLERL